MLWPSVFAAFGIAVLVGLGVWQVQRLHWKEKLIASITERAYRSPVSLDEALRRWSEVGEIDYLRTSVTGSFRHEKELYLYDVVQGTSGWRVITPLVTGDSAIVLVDRGFVPDAIKDPGKRSTGQIQGPVTVTGIALSPQDQGMFTPENEPARDIWFWRDLEGMAASAVDPSERELVVPFYIAAERSAVPGGWPKGGVTRLELPNRHREYAITWFGLAGALAAVYGAFVWSRLRPGVT